MSEEELKKMAECFSGCTMIGVEAVYKHVVRPLETKIADRDREIRWLKDQIKKAVQ